MMDVLIVGGDAGLREGVLQAVRAAGLRVEGCADAESARDMGDSPPLAVVLHIDEARRAGAAKLIPLRQGGVVILFREGEGAVANADQAFGRTVVAELQLPLERARLTALLTRIVERARITGRDRRPPDAPMSP